MRLSLLFPAASLLSLTYGQPLIPLTKGAIPTGVENSIGEGRVIEVWSPAGVLLRAQRVGADQLPVENILVRPDGVRLDIPPRAVRNALICASANYLIRGHLINGGPHLGVMRLDTMREQTLPLPGGIGRGDMNDSIAVLTGFSSPTSARVNVIDLASARLIGSVDLPLRMAGLIVSLQGKRPLLIDTVLLDVYPLLIDANSVRVGAPYRLTGPSFPKVADTPPPAAGSFVSPLIGLHSSTRAGNDLFFINPRKVKEGMTIVETDALGREVSHLSVDTMFNPVANHAIVIPRPELTRTTEDKIVFLGLDGYSYHFARP